MTGGPPRRWDDDSPEEDFEAHRARELARLERSVAEEKLRPLADALTEHGILPADGEGEGWAGPVILPDWWDEIPEPHGQCPTCQRPGVVTRFFDRDPSRPVPCPECSAAMYADPAPPSMAAWWAGLTAGARRLHIAATYGTDPWSGRRCSIRVEWTDITSDGKLSTSYPPYLGAAPDAIWWGAQRQG